MRRPNARYRRADPRSIAPPDLLHRTRRDPTTDRTARDPATDRTARDDHSPRQVRRRALPHATRRHRATGDSARDPATGDTARDEPDHTRSGDGPFPPRRAIRDGVTGNGRYGTRRSSRVRKCPE